MPTLIEILDSHENVIIDGSARIHSSFMWDIYEIDDYSCFKSEDIRRESSIFQKFAEILNHPNSRTTPEINHGIKIYAEKIGEKISFLSSRNIQRGNRANKWRRGLKKSGNLDERRLLNQRLLKRLQGIVFTAYCSSKRKELRKIDDPHYETFADMLVQLERILHLKRDTGFLLGYHNEDRSYSSEADERVAATILWQSMFSDKSPVLVTRDRDFINLLEVIPKIIGSDDFLPYNKLFRRQVIGNPFILYYTKSRGESYKHHLNNLYIDFNPNFKLHGASLENNKKMEKIIRGFWEQFSETHNLD